jgi:hypothetical protein
MQRRQFIEVTGAAALAAAAFGQSAGRKEYKYRFAFDAWINDVRNESMPLENWPYGVLDDKTVDAIINALDLQAQTGYNGLDIIGLMATYSWPVDIVSVAGQDRRRRVNKIIKAAHDRKMKVICFPTGVYSWGFDDIIQHDPSIRTDNKHVMNPLREESWVWQRKVYDYMLDNYEIDGFHLESGDQGRCRTKECMERWPSDAAYHCYVTAKAADYLRSRRKDLVLTAILIGYSTWGREFTADEEDELVKLSRSVDCIFDQGHGQPFISQANRKKFVQKLSCDYGTSGGIWIYPPQRWERLRWFLPYTTGTGGHIKQLYEDGGRGVMYYQGPLINPSTEVNVAFGGQMMMDAGRDVETVLAAVLESLYKPETAAAHRKLVEIFQRAEKIYFDQWDEERIRTTRKRPVPGELHLTSLFGASPNAADYVAEPYLTKEGRLAYKQGLIAIYKELLAIENDFRDDGRISRIGKGIEGALVDINNIAASTGETEVWDDRHVGRRF